MPRGWELALREITPEQIKCGLDTIGFEFPDWPPTAFEFVNLCTGQGGSHSTNSAAYIAFDDPKHPHYQPPRIESDEHKAEVRRSGNNELAAMKGLFN